MGRWSKAHQACQDNLPKNAGAHVDDSSNDNGDDYRPPSEGERENTSQHAEVLLFLEENDLESDLELDDDDEDLMVEEIEREAAILRFSEVLTQAQAMAVKAKQDLERKQKWGLYKKNSACTKHHHAQNQRKLAESGHTFINQYFPKTKETTPPLPSQASSNINNRRQF
jgi:hypothetical protein